jgi:hypothetical protein
MPQVGFKPTIPVFERAKIVRALDAVATAIAEGQIAQLNEAFTFENAEQGKRTGTALC